jgi:hypothetical protein
MNNAQRTVLICASIVVALIFLFPPFLSGSLRVGWWYSGHRFLTCPPDGSDKIDFSLIALEVLATLAFTTTAYLIAGGRRR